jgi:membrane protein DedA with SNARE-associated domain
MTFESLVLTYGYPALFVAMFLEGETPLIIAGFLAHRGYLSLPVVMVVATVATILIDQILFHLGRKRGRAIIQSHPSWAEKAGRLELKFKHYHTLILVGFRFLYGLRTVAPLAIGISGVGALRFILLNTVGAVLWVSVVAGVGYGLGETLERLVSDFYRYEGLAVAFLLATSALFWVVARFRKRHSGSFPERPSRSS